jgi:hypothetical protein
MRRVRVVPGWQYYPSGKYHSCLYLSFQSIGSSPGKQDVAGGAFNPWREEVPGPEPGYLVIRLRRDFQDAGPDVQPA